MRWQYDEMRQIGTDYGDISNVRVYDDKMEKIRDFKKEAKDIVDNVPKPVKEGLGKEDAEAAKQQLEAAGATIEIA